MNQQGQGGTPPLHWRRRAGVLLGVCALMGAVACGDVPTAAEPSARAEALEALERSAGRGVGGGTVEVVCSISYATHGGPYAYQYGRITMKVPAASRAADGSTRQYRFRNHAGTQIVGAANCTTPATELAAAHLDRFFGVKQRGGRRVEPSGGAVLMGGDTHTLPTIHVNACQYGGEYPYCDPPPIEWDQTLPPKEVQVCYTDCGGGGGGPRGDSPEPPPLPEEEPCKTGDPVLDSPDLAPGFKQLWEASNYSPSTPQEQRLEQYSWIVKTADGYRLEPMGLPPAPCGPEGSFTVVPPSGTVAFVHTHPWALLETQTSCAEGPGTYLGLPSVADLATSQTLGNMPGYILDANGMTKFSAASGMKMEARHGRCAH